MMGKSVKRACAALVILGLVFLGMEAGTSSSLGQPPSGCTQTLTPAQPLQEAVDRAEAGAVLCLGAGTWETNLTIRKDLILVGRGLDAAGKPLTVLKGREKGKPVVLVDDIPTVTLIGLALTGAQSVSEEQECFKPDDLVCPDGLNVRGAAQVTLINGVASGNAYVGAWAINLAQATIIDSESFNNQWGIWASYSASVTISNVQVHDNTSHGIGAGPSATVTVSSAKILKNGADCKRCSGIVLFGDSTMTITSSAIKDNSDWGVAAWLKKCGYREDDFTGKVEFQGNNVIEGNNKSGNQNGKGNPGNHPFKSLPDGQVCLP